MTNMKRKIERFERAVRNDQMKGMLSEQESKEAEYEYLKSKTSLIKSVSTMGKKGKINGH